MEEAAENAEEEKDLIEAENGGAAESIILVFDLGNVLLSPDNV